MDAALSEDDKLAGRYRQFNTIFNLLIEVEGVGRLVEAFFTAELDRANSIVRAPGKPQAPAFRRGIINRDPNRQLKNLTPIGRKDARILIVFDHERAGLVPLNRRRLRTLVKIL